MGFFSSESAGSSGGSGSSGGAFNSSCLSFNSGNCTFTPITNTPSFTYGNDVAYNQFLNGSTSGSSVQNGFCYTPCFSSGGGMSAAEAARQAELRRQEEINSSTEKTKTEETQEEKTPATTEAEETGPINKKEGTETTEAKGAEGSSYKITESSAPLSSQIDNTSKDKKNCYEIPDYDLAGFCTTPFYLGEKGNGSKEIENSVAAQARAKEGDTVNGNELSKADIDWAKQKTDGTFTIGDLQRGNDLPEMPEIKYTPEVKEGTQGQQEQQAQNENPYQITTGQEGMLSQSETVPESPVVDIQEEQAGGEEAKQETQEGTAEGQQEAGQENELEKEGWDNWSDSQKEVVDSVFGKDTLTPGGAALIQKLGVQDKFVNICSDFSKIAERRAVAKEVDDDLLNETLTQVRELIEGLDDPKAMAFTEGMGSTFDKEASRVESEMLAQLKGKMIDLLPGMQNLDRLTDALKPNDDVQAVKDAVMKVGNMGVQALYKMTIADIDSTMMAADARYMNKEQQNEKLVAIAKQNADTFGEDMGKDITQNAFVGFLTGDHNLVDRAAAALGQGAWDGIMKDGVKFVSYAEKIIGKKLAEKVYDIAVNGKDPVEELSKTCFDEIAHARGKAEPYINLAKGVGKILAGFAGLAITGGASAKLLLDGANDLANLSWNWQNAKIGMQIEGMQALLEGMETVGLSEAGVSQSDGINKDSGIINRLADSGRKGGGSPYTQGNIDVTGNGTSRYERKKKELEGLNYNTNTAQGFNEGIGSEEEMSGIYKNLLQNDGAARKFVSDLQAS